MEFALAFNAGGMWNILMKWIDSDFEHSYDDLIKAFEISRGIPFWPDQFSFG